MKRFFVVLSVITLLCLTIFTLFSCKEEPETSEEQSDTNVDQPITDENQPITSENKPVAELLEAKDFTMNGNVGTLIVSNDTEVYSFIKQISVPEKTSWSISTDLAGRNVVTTKTISLEAGDNTVYLLVSSDDGKDINLYTMTIRRRPIYSVVFETNGGSSVQSQQIEESYLATEPTTTKAGYTFMRWNFDFSKPITSNITVEAVWQVHTDIPYKVEYYLQNLEDDDYTLQETCNFTGTTDTVATAEIKSFKHFTKNPSVSNASGTINGDGSLVLKVYYTRDQYLINVSGENSVIANPVNGYFKYGYSIESCFTQSHLGYEFDGWYCGGERETEDNLISFIVSAPVDYKANSKTKAEMQNFIFSATTTTCSISGIKDKTITEITIPDYVTSIANDTFSGCNIVNATIPTLAISYIRNAKLKNVTITSGQNVDSYAFSDCYSLTSVNIGNSVTSIGSRAFYNCSGLTSITLGEKVTDIESEAFWGCYKLVEIYNKSSLIVECCESNGYVGNYAKNIYKNEGESKINTDNGFIFYVDNKTVSLISYTGEDTQLILPNSITQIYQYAFCNAKISSVIIPDSVIDIGEHAFYNCSNLTDIAIPNSVISIGHSVFSGCRGLCSMIIPFVGAVANKAQNDTYQYPFGYYFGTDSSYIGNSAIRQDYYASSTSYTTSTIYLIPSNLRSVTVYSGNILYGAFYGCSNLVNVIIGNDVTSIGSQAFYNCNNLASITIGSGVTSIGSQAFCGCSNLRNATIPDNITSIGTGVFSGCNRLTSISIPFIGATANNQDSDTYQYSFGYIFGTASYNGGERTEQSYYDPSTTTTTYIAYYIPTSLSSVTIRSGVITHTAFQNCRTLQDITIGNKVTNIEASTFEGYDWLLSITIGNNVTSIGKYAFYGCYRLESISFVENSRLTSIGEWAFGGCVCLTDFNIPNGVISIGEKSFYGCNGLTSVIIPESVTQIGESAFCNCTSLSSIVIPFVGAEAGKTESDTYQYPFGYIFGTTSYTGSTATEQYYYKYSTSSLTSETYYIPSSLHSVSIMGGNILRGAFHNCNNLTNITIGSGATSIEESAFSSCSGLASISISDKVTCIGSCAFSDCSNLTSIIIPASVKNIGGYTFLRCSNLKNIEFDKKSQLTSIGEWAFKQCSKLESIIIPNSVMSMGIEVFSGCSALMSITIPDGVTSIGSNAFYGCSALTSVIFGNDSQLTNIGYGAFYGCSALTSITIPDGVTSIGSNAFYGCSKLVSSTFENASGWYVSTEITATDGTDISLTDVYANAIYLKSTYTYYYWKRR